MASAPGGPESVGNAEENIVLDVEPKLTTATPQVLLRSVDRRGDFLSDLSIAETLLVSVCCACLLMLALSLLYFYIVKRLGRFSDNPWYRRRVYYEMSPNANAQNPARCFNVFQRERPNTLSLSGNLATPTTVIVPIPMMDAAVGDDKIYNGSKDKKSKGKKKQHGTGSRAVVANTHNAVGPVLLAPHQSMVSKSSSRKRDKSKYGKVHQDDDSDDSGAYVTPPQDSLAAGVASRKDKPPRQHRK